MPDFIKITKGLVLYDPFPGSGGPGGKWTSVNSNSTSAAGWENEDGQIRGAATSGDKKLTNHTQAIPRMFIQAILRFTASGIEPGLVGNWDFSSAVRSYYLNLMPSTNQIRLAFRGNGSSTLTQLAIASKTLAINTDYPVQLVADVGTRNGWVDGTTVSHTFTHDNWNGRRRQFCVAGLHILGTPNTGDLIAKQFLWMRNNSVRVYDLSAGQKAKILDDSETVVAQATESGGVATIPLSRFAGLSVLVPVNGWAKILVTDASDNPTGMFEAQSAAERIYPGDRFMPKPTSAATPVWTPETALNPGTGTNEQGGPSLTPPESPSYESQKNFGRVAVDSRTGVMLGVQGAFGAFGEVPATSQKIIRSLDGGMTWTQVSDLDGVIEFYDAYGEPGPFGTPFEYSIILDIEPGEDPGEWLLFDFAGGYYLSVDNGVTWSAKQHAGIGFAFADPEDSFPSFYGLFGGEGLFDTRNQAVQNYEGQLGFPFMYQSSEGDVAVGVRRSLGPNGSLGWEDSLLLPVGNYTIPSWGMPVLLGANGRWILIVDDFMRNGNPNVMINTSPDLDPEAWGEPFFLVSEAFCQDIYGGTGSGLNAGFRRLNFGGSVVNPSGTSAKSGNGAGNARVRLKFIPMTGHPVGGRWWLLGARDTLLFSDDNGETWSNVLANHTGSESAMHPFLNWRRTYPDSAANAVNGGYLYSYPQVIDIGYDPLGSGRLISIGVTYMMGDPDLERLGIVNRLAVFTTSEDGGDTWDPGVKQLPLSLEKISHFPPRTAGEGGSDHVATAAHIITRLV